MKTLIALLGTTVFVCGSQVVLSDQAPLRPTTASNSYNGNYRGLMGACCLPDGSCVMEYATQWLQFLGWNIHGRRLCRQSMR